MSPGPRREPRFDPPRWQLRLWAATVGLGIITGLVSEIIARVFGGLQAAVNLVIVVCLIVGAAGLASWSYHHRRAEVSRIAEVSRVREGSRVRRVDQPGPQPQAPGGAIDERPVPDTLPRPPEVTIPGSDLAVKKVVETLRDEPAMAVIGRRGVGTSTCVLRAANQLRDEYQNGRFYHDLRAGGQPASAREVLAMLARDLGTRTPRSGRPAALARAAERIWEVLHGNPLLVVLDNIDRVSQVAALLPPIAGQGRLLLAASTLEAIAGVPVQRINEPTTEEAMQLLRNAVEDGRGAEPNDLSRDEAEKIVALASWQPRGIRGLGYQIGALGWSPATVREEVEHAVAAYPHQRLPPCLPGRLLADRDVAYAGLDPDAARVFRRMALATGPVDRSAVAAAAGLSQARAGRAVDELVRRLFVTVEADRYRIRPELRPAARLHLRWSETAPGRIGAWQRLARHLARQAERRAASLATSVSSADDPHAWFLEHDGLLRETIVEASRAAAVAPLPPRLRYWLFRLVVALCSWYATRDDRFGPWGEVCRAVRGMSTPENRSEMDSWAEMELGVLQRRQGRPDLAASLLATALARGGGRWRAQLLTNLGLAMLDLARQGEGQLTDALEQLELARGLLAPGDRGGIAVNNLALGAAYVLKGDLKGDLDRAVACLVHAANTFYDIGDQRGYSAALSNLVLAYMQRGEYQDAAQTWMVLLEHVPQVAIREEQAAALLNVAVSLQDRGQAEQAAELLARADELLDPELSSRVRGRLRLAQGDAARQLGQAGPACRYWREAEEILEVADDAPGAEAARRRLTDHGCGEPETPVPVPPARWPRSRRPVAQAAPAHDTTARDWWGRLRRIAAGRSSGNPPGSGSEG